MPCPSTLRLDLESSHCVWFGTIIWGLCHGSSLNAAQDVPRGHLVAIVSSHGSRISKSMTIRKLQKGLVSPTLRLSTMETVQMRSTSTLTCPRNEQKLKYKYYSQLFNVYSETEYICYRMSYISFGYLNLSSVKCNWTMPAINYKVWKRVDLSFMKC